MKLGNRPSLANFELRRTIGTGGMSVVYEALDKKLQRTVAVKVLHRHLCEDDAATRRFRREALAAAGMDHPNIVRIYDYLTEGDYHCIVMEYVPGVDLESVTRTKETLCFDSTLFVMNQVAVALAEAHSQGIMHRDIKPSNILLRHGNRVMLSDFGLARRTIDTRLTQDNAVAGTPCYMSPEQIAGKELDHSSDIYAWGVTFYSVFSGRLPYLRQDFPDVVNEIKNGRTTFHDDVRKELPPKFFELLRGCLHYDPRERVRDGAQLLAMLEEYGAPPRTDLSELVSISSSQSAAPGNAPDVSSTNVFRPRRRGRAIAVSGIVAIATALTVGGLVLLRTGDKETAAVEPPKKPVEEQILPREPAGTETAVSQPDKDRPQSNLQSSSAGAAPRMSSHTGASPPRPSSAEADSGPPAVAVPDSGRLFVGCRPWAYVSVDGKNYGPTPLESPIVLSEGKHLIRLYNEFCEPLEDEVEIVGGGEVRRRYTLERKPAYRQ